MKSFLELKMKKRLLKSKKPAQIYSYILVTQPSRDDQSDQWPKFWSHLLAGRPKNNSRKKYRNCSKRSFVPVFRSWHWESWNYVVEPKYLYMKKNIFCSFYLFWESFTVSTIVSHWQYLRLQFLLQFLRRQYELFRKTDHFNFNLLLVAK